MLICRFGTGSTPGSVRITRAKFVFLCTVGLATLAHAGLTPCAGTYNLGAGANGLVGGAASAGCEQVDKEFNAFNYIPDVSNPVLGGAVPVTFSGVTPTGAISVQFGDSNPTWDAAVSGTSTSASIFYNITVDPSAPSAPPPGLNYAIVALALSQNVSLTTGFPPGTADSIVLYEYFCAGGAAACAGGSSATGNINMTAPTAGFLVYKLNGNGNGYTAGTSSCFNNGNTNAATDCATLANAAPSSSLINFGTSNYSGGFQSIYTFSTLSVNSGGDDTALNFFKETYFQELDTPEPATFGVMGIALAGLGILSFRKKR